MNRLVTLLAFSVALGGPASAQTFGPSPDVRIPRVVGGEVDISGGRVLGKGFSSHIVTMGEYAIVFDQGLFRGGCPVLNATSLGKIMNVPTAEVYQRSFCSRTFYVYWLSADSNGSVNTAFQFIAVGTSGG
jgi:hypothetical protein